MYFTTPTICKRYYLILLLGVFLFASFTLSNKEVINPTTIQSYPLPENLNFAGEPVPIHIPDVYERMDRELMVNAYWHSNSLLMIKRINKYFPIIEPILEKHNVPNDFKYIAVIESGLINATSPAGAKGIWQIMRATAKDFKLEVNKNVDERYHLEKTTELACKYFLKAKEKFGSWTLAAASYNSGRARIARYLTTQQVNTYYDLLLGEETGRYVFRILAMKELLTNPSRYGFEVPSSHKYKRVLTRKLPVDSAISNLASFAKMHKVNYKQLKIFNPWLLENHLNNKSRKQYYIEIPTSKEN
ncbi:MAG: lytic transglycosylase domain-containing protein [Flavobacteriaceae bacterium]|nr:lytic transglycosylase domain-containing protein [Flavobacteriaceae bacterium]MDG2314860.1 lytic transglycosylase domain-containing protein [Flavobacteriaceae bacterium]